MSLKNLHKSLNKRLKNTDIQVGFSEPDTWVGTGSFVLNNIISGDFHKGFPLGKSMLIAGDPGAGKSLIAASIAKHAQDNGIIPVILDTEAALDTSFLEGVGLDVSEDKLIRMDIVTITDAHKAIAEVLNAVEDAYPPEDRPKLLFVIDSLGMMLTEKESKENDKGEMKGDMGQKAKQLKQFYRMATSKLAAKGAGLIATNHTWNGSDAYGNPITEINGGKGQVYASSIVLMVGKKEIKENFKAETEGVYIRVKCSKTRFTKPFRKVELVVPWETGIDPYSGLLDAFVSAGIVSQGGAWYTYVESGKKFQRKNAQPILDEILAANATLSLNVIDEDEETQLLMEKST